MAKLRRTTHHELWADALEHHYDNSPFTDNTIAYQDPEQRI